MKTNRAQLLSIVSLIVACTAVPAISESTSPQKSTGERKVYRDERPDPSRGWVVIAKSSFWPLCYEALDRLEEAEALIGKGEPEQLADALEKSGAWLDLASSASMIDARAHSSSERNYDAADAVRSGSDTWSDQKLRDLIVLNKLSMAKSHVLRAGSADEKFKAMRIPNRKPASSDIVREANREIDQERKLRSLAQYQFDTREAVRHLQVALDYYEAACKTAGAEVLTPITDEIPEISSDASGEALTNFFDEQVRPRVTSMLEQIDSQRTKLVAAIDN